MDSRLRGNDEGEGTAPSLLIKWPNDLLLDGKKLAGILLERADAAVIIGFGVNLAHAPANLDRPATSLAAHAPAPTPDIFIIALVDSFAHWIAAWRDEGLPRIRPAWLERAHSIGTPLSADTGEGKRIEGAFANLDTEGSLLLRSADGAVHIIHAGDVFVAQR
ncbi:MAG: biotin--[acetyl-CoA-carboxylase] ligase [Sphingomonadaceae bacterium]|nr:biotin--[acetyl-CoA-carboxylase] ligase [Sphingomonadaceae bacterium]